MPSFGDRYPNTGWFKADDLRGQGDLVLQIDYVELDVTLNNQLKDVVHFINDQRKLVLNKPVGTMIANLHGDEINNWGEKWIALFCDDTVEFDAGGKHFRGGVRVRPKVPEMEGASAPQPRPKAKPDFDDEIPF